MKILIIENEGYLAQSILSKLVELGYEVEILVDEDTLRSKIYDIVLLSTNVSDYNYFIKKFRNSIIILLNSYITHDTVIKPLKNGANDYIVKPFIMDELIRKIEHQIEFSQLKKQNELYEKSIGFLFDDVEDMNINYPLVIKSSYQKLSDFFLAKYMIENKIEFTFIDLDEVNNPGLKEEQNYYLINFHKLKRQEKKNLLDKVEKYKVIISTLDLNEEIEGANTFSIKNSEQSFEPSGTILSIDEYVQYIINNFQAQYPDTELSKKLGISRKSLWEKRKKYGLQKRK